MESQSSFCTHCGAALAAGDDYCGQCGVARCMRHAGGEPQELRWEANIPAGDLLWDAAKVIGLAFGLVFGLIEIISRLSGNSLLVSLAESVGRNDPSVYYAGGFIAFWLLLSALVVWAVYRHGYEVSFAADGEGIRMQTRPGTRRTNRIINTALFWLSLFSGKPGGMGAALLAETSQSGAFAWEDVARVIPVPAKKILILKSSWRTLVKLYCTPENYDAVRTLAEQHVRQRQLQGLAQAAQRPGLGSYAGKILALAASLGSVALIGQSPLLPQVAGVIVLGLLVLAEFATGGAVRRRIAWLTAAVLLGLAISMAINAFEPLGEFYLRYYRYERLERMPYAAQFAASLAGLALLAVVSWRHGSSKNE